MKKTVESGRRWRRLFLQTLGMGALAAKVPPLLSMTHKSGSKLPVLGQGEHT